MVTDRLGLHPPALASEKFGTYFITHYSADIQQIDDLVQVKDLTGEGEFPTYDANGFLVPSGVKPEDLEMGLDALLTDWGMVLYKGESALAALSPSTLGKSLLTQGVGASPIFGYPAHSTCTGLTTGDPHTQYLLRSILNARGSLPFFGVAGWAELVKGVAGYVLMQGADDPYWGQIKLDDCAAPDDNTDLDASTDKHGLMKKYVTGSKKVLLEDGSAADNFAVAHFQWGDGSAVVTAGNRFVAVPKACKIIAAEIRSTDATGDLKTGSITIQIFIHDYNANADSVAASDTFSLSSASSYQETGLSIAVADGKYITAIVSGIATVTQVGLKLKLEAT